MGKRRPSTKDQDDKKHTFALNKYVLIVKYFPSFKQESPTNAKGTRDSSACMKAHCEQMQNP